MTDWDRLQQRLAKTDFASTRLLVGLDFDGTLADIAATPDQAKLTPRTRALLDELAARPDTRVAILSGRALDDVKRKVGLAGIYYGGNHGLELEGPSLRWTHPGALELDGDLRRALEKTLASFPGALVEDKRFGVALHYRAVPERRVRRLRERVREKLRRLQEGFRIHRIKKAFELRPDVGWDKGHALETIRRTLVGGWLAVFVGDDRTDEDGFRTLGPQALTVRVGRTSRSAARFVVPRREFVDRLLERLAHRPA